MDLTLRCWVGPSGPEDRAGGQQGIRHVQNETSIEHSSLLRVYLARVVTLLPRPEQMQTPFSICIRQPIT